MNELIKKFYETQGLKGMGELIFDSEITAHITDKNGKTLYLLNLLERIFLTSDNEKLGTYEYKNNRFIYIGK